MRQTGIMGIEPDKKNPTNNVIMDWRNKSTEQKTKAEHKTFSRNVANRGESLIDFSRIFRGFSCILFHIKRLLFSTNNTLQ